MIRKTEIIIALIGALATVGASYIVATSGAQKKAESVVYNELKKLNVVMAGYVDAQGNLQHEKGELFTVTRPDTGTYRIEFSEPMDIRPVVVATSDGGQKGANIRVVKATRLGVTLEGRAYSSNDKSNTAFNFIVVTPKTR
ncbi:MAG: hypothetical protein E2O37_09030 [Proteobacteria bacterium]|nr:MAG: hypothetical protein E2O37_09030 [Pseudomonadota bacterium]